MPRCDITAGAGTGGASFCREFPPPRREFASLQRIYGSKSTGWKKLPYIGASREQRTARDPFLCPAERRWQRDAVPSPRGLRGRFGNLEIWKSRVGKSPVAFGERGRELFGEIVGQGTPSSSYPLLLVRETWAVYRHVYIVYIHAVQVLKSKVIYRRGWADN